MHELPGATFWPEDASDARCSGSDFVASGHLGLKSLDLKDVAEFRSSAFREVLELGGFAIAIVDVARRPALFDLGPALDETVDRLNLAPFYVADLVDGIRQQRAIRKLRLWRSRE